MMHLRANICVANMRLANMRLANMRLANMRLGALAGLALLSVPASAANTVIRSFVFPSSAAGAPGTSLNFALPDPFALQTGDTLDVTVTFAGGALSLTDEDGIFPAFFHDYATGMNLSAQGQVQFLNPTGALRTGPIAISQNNAAAHIGFFIDPALYRTGAGAIGFTGIRQLITINTTTLFSEGSDDPRGPDDLFTYRSGVVWVFGQTPGGGGGVPVIPEPATWAMMIAGFGLVGGMMRRRPEARTA